MNNEESRHGIVKTSFGSTVSILYNKDESMTQAIIGKTKKPHHYFAMFDRSDVQFVIKMDNTACKDRKMAVGLELLNKRRGFVVDRGESEQLESYESFGGKFHVISQRSRNGEEVISSITVGSDISYSDASIQASQIKFTVSYSKSFNNTFKIFVKYRDNRYEVNVMKSNTLKELKYKIEAQLGFMPFAVSFKSVILMGDTNILGRYGISENDEISIPTEIKAMNFEIEENSNKPFQIWLAKHSTVTNELLKFMIDTEEDIPVEDQKFQTKNGTSHNLTSDDFDNDGVIKILSRKCGGGEAIIRRCVKCNWKHYPNTRCISEDEYYSQRHEKGIVCLSKKEKSEQEFVSTTFIEDESVEVMSFTIEMRLINSRYSSAL